MCNANADSKWNNVLGMLMLGQGFSNHPASAKVCQPVLCNIKGIPTIFPSKPYTWSAEVDCMSAPDPLLAPTLQLHTACTDFLDTSKGQALHS